MFSLNRKRLGDASVALFLHVFTQDKRCYKDLVLRSIQKNKLFKNQPLSTGGIVRLMVRQVPSPWS